MATSPNLLVPRSYRASLSAALLKAQVKNLNSVFYSLRRWFDSGLCTKNFWFAGVVDVAKGLPIFRNIESRFWNELIAMKTDSRTWVERGLEQSLR